MGTGMCHQAHGDCLEDLLAVPARDTAFPSRLGWGDCMEEGMGMGLAMGMAMGMSVVIGIRIGMGMGVTPVPTERHPQKINSSGVCCSLTRG